MPLNPHDAQFLTAAVRPSSYPPPGPPEVAFAGRSNVGKSSLINTLLRRKKLVRVSSRPGCTQQINFFSLGGDQARLVDLPGYGFAKVPLSVKAGWRRMIESYLTGRPTLKGVVVILDIRREPSAEDLMLLEWLKSLDLAVVLALTKADKLSRNQAAGRLAKLRPVLSPFDQRPVLFSALNGQGREEIWARMGELVDGPETPAAEPATVDPPVADA
ncbi:MAG: ribosome biogenesis GTP-binding protein YihA/YsxC [Pseudomonadota bacterium]